MRCAGTARYSITRCSWWNLSKTTIETVCNQSTVSGILRRCIQLCVCLITADSRLPSPCSANILFFFHSFLKIARQKYQIIRNFAETPELPTSNHHPVRPLNYTNHFSLQLEIPFKITNSHSRHSWLGLFFLFLLKNCTVQLNLRTVNTSFDYQNWLFFLVLDLMPEMLNFFTFLKFWLKNWLFCPKNQFLPEVFSKFDLIPIFTPSFLGNFDLNLTFLLNKLNFWQTLTIKFVKRWFFWHFDIETWKCCP